MALISKTIANLLNGVSQQPPSIRNPTQCEVQENYLSDVAFGNCHRPPSIFLARLASLGPSPYKPHLHTIDRGPDSRHKVMITDGDLKVFDAITGEEKPVAFPNGKAYLASDAPYQDFQCLTIGRQTYILNKTVVTQQENHAVPDDFNYYSCALVFVKQGDYSTDYTITVQVTTNPGGVVTGPTAITKTTSASDPNDIKTSKIATDLKTGLDVAFPLKVSTQVFGSVMYLQSFATPTFYEMTGIAVEDSKGNNNLRLIRSQVQKFADLPTIAPIYYPVQVVGDKASGFDDYYVRFYPDTEGDPFGNGSWQETWKSGTHHRPSGASMPMILTDNGDGTFTCENAVWGSREAGDEYTNPTPEFIGKTIDHIFTFGNRLGFLYGGKVALSEVGQYTNFYLTTVVTFLDSDPIFIQELNGFDRWLYAVPLAEKIVLFSHNGQAVIQADGLLTPKTATIEGATRYSVSPSCPPLLIGDNIYFTADNGNFSRVYEYYTRGDVEVFQAAEVTSHCPEYLPSGLIKLAGNDGAKMILAVGTDNTDVSGWSTIYVYRYFWIGDQKVQSSWSKFIFPDNLHCLDASIIDNHLYLVSMDPNTGDVLYHVMDLNLSQVDPAYGAKTRTHLDLRLDGGDLPMVSEEYLRTYTLPFSVHDDLKPSFRVYRKERHTSDPRVSWGKEVEIESWPSDNKIRIVDRDSSISADVWIGTTFTSRFTLSEIHLKDEQNGAQVPTEEGKLTLKKISFLYDDSFYFRVEVTPQRRDTKTFTMTPYVLGDPTPLSEITGRSGRLSVPIGAENTKVTISVVNDSVVPHRLLSAEWVGQYAILSRRF